MLIWPCVRPQAPWLVGIALLMSPALRAQEPADAPAQTQDQEAQPAPAEPGEAEEAAPAEQGTETEEGTGEGLSPEEKSKKSAAGKASDKLEKLAPGEVRVRADKQESPEAGHYHATGFVDLRVSDMRIQCDVLDVYEIEKPDGTKSKKVIAVGNVVFMREDERLAGERLTMELESGQGTFERAQGYVQPGMIVEGRTIERLDANTYRVKGGKFTSCNQPNPRWGFTASSAVIHVDDKVVARNVFFEVKDVPAFYFPLFVYPIQEDQRTTGILLPHFGSSSVRGFNFGTGFFWAMGRSLDQTFYADSYSKAGYGLGHEVRWALDSPSRGDLRTYGFSPEAGGSWDYDINWSALQTLPGQARATLQVRRYSNTLFQQRFQDNFNLATSRTERAQLSLQRNFRFGIVQALAEDNRTYFSDQTRINRRLPSLRLSRPTQRIGRSDFVFGFEARGEDLAVGNQDELDRYSRFDVAPELSRPLASTFFQVTPQIRLRYTRYGASLDTAGLIDGPPLDRRYLEGVVEIVGPTFSRVFNNGSGIYSDKFKHVIGPEVTWTYRTSVDDFALIPKFDGYDQQLGTHQIDYALVQRLLAKRPGPDGKPVPYEFLSWRLGQTYYVQIRDAQNEFDPNYSSGVFGPGGLPDHNSPLSSRLRVRPTPNISTNFDMEYDVNFSQLRNLSLGESLQGERGRLVASYNRARRVAEDPADRMLIRDFVRGAAELAILPGRLIVDGSLDYDILRKIRIHSSARLRWNVQCCGFSVETIQYNYNQRIERQFRFNVELANLGSIGNFLGDDPLRAGGRP